MGKIAVSRTIYKYEVPLTDYIEIRLPVGAEILTFIMNNNISYVYALVDKNQSLYEIRKFRLYGTGHNFDLKSYRYIGTVMKESGITFVFHLFEQL